MTTILEKMEQAAREGVAPGDSAMIRGVKAAYAWLEAEGMVIVPASVLSGLKDEPPVSGRAKVKLAAAEVFQPSSAAAEVSGIEATEALCFDMVVKQRDKARELVRTIEARLAEAVKRVDDASPPFRAYVEHVMAPVRLALDDIKEADSHE